jgi:hypothetical protein
MRYRVENESKWYKTLRGAKNRAIDRRGTKPITVKVVDENGAVVWSTDHLPKLTFTYSHETVVRPKQPDLF